MPLKDLGLLIMVEALETVSNEKYLGPDYQRRLLWFRKHKETAGEYAWLEYLGLI